MQNGNNKTMYYQQICLMFYKRIFTYIGFHLFGLLKNYILVSITWNYICKYEKINQDKLPQQSVFQHQYLEGSDSTTNPYSLTDQPQPPIYTFSFILFITYPFIICNPHSHFFLPNSFSHSPDHSFFSQLHFCSFLLPFCLSHLLTVYCH